MRAHGEEIVSHRRRAARYFPRAQLLSDDGDFRIIVVLVALGEKRSTVAAIGGKETRDFRYMDPAKQSRVARAVSRAVGQMPLYAVMYRTDPCNQPFGLSGRAISGAGDELSGAAQAAAAVLPEVGMVPNPCKRGRMEHLQQERGEAARHHRREVRMHTPRHGVRAEQAIVAGRSIQIDPLTARTEDAAYAPLNRMAQHLVGQGRQEADGSGHMLVHHPSTHDRRGWIGRRRMEGG